MKKLYLVHGPLYQKALCFNLEIAEEFVDKWKVFSEKISKTIFIQEVYLYESSQDVRNYFKE